MALLAGTTRFLCDLSRRSLFERRGAPNVRIGCFYLVRVKRDQLVAVEVGTADSYLAAITPVVAKVALVVKDSDSPRQGEIPQYLPSKVAGQWRRRLWLLD